MGYDFAITGVPEKSKDFLGKRRNSEMSELSWLHGSKRYVACDDVSRATPLRWGRDNKNDIRAERRKATARVLLSTVASYIAVQTVQLFSHKGG